MSAKTPAGKKQSGEKSDRPNDLAETAVVSATVSAQVAKAVYFLIRIAQELSDWLG